MNSHTTTPSRKVPAASQRPSGLNATALTPNLSWVRVWSCSPLLVSQIHVVPSIVLVAKPVTRGSVRNWRCALAR
jgi:hypothetical protein